MNKQLSIFHITPFFSPNVGGVETHLENLTDYLKKENYKQIVITYQALVGAKRGAKKEISENLEIYRLPWIAGLYYKTLANPLIHFFYLTPYLLFYVLHFLLFRSSSVDILHAHGINAAFIGSIAKIFFRKPLIISLYVELHFSKGSWLTNFYLWPFRNSSKILVMTERSKGELVKFGINSSKIIVYSHWVDQNIFKPISKKQIRKFLGLKEDKFTVLFVGRLTKEKGTYLLVDIAKGLTQLDFIIVASGDLSDTLKQEASKTRNISYVGRVDYSQLAAYYQAADLLIVPSLVSNPKSTFEEGIPRVVMEALSCGTPVIGTDNGGIKEVLETGQVGFIIPSTASNFIEVIQRLQKNPAKILELKKRCVDYARERFNIRKANIISQTYQQVYATEN